LWNKKGIVIDPGYDFVQNFYEEGYSIGDINAVIVTHTHPDHDDELNTILTLVEEWNQARQAQRATSGNEDKSLYIDLFLNEGAYRKYNNWLYANKIKITKIFLLQSSRWDKKSGDSSKGAEDPDPVLSLKHRYNLEIETIPAWHDELIDTHSSVGLIFKLYEGVIDTDPKCRIGITGDTEYYDKIQNKYKDVDILVAHLGDIKFREILSYAKAARGRVMLDDFVSSWCDFKGLDKKYLYESFWHYIIKQDLYGIDPEKLPGIEEHPSKSAQIEQLAKDIKQNDKDAIIRDFTKYSVPAGFQYFYKNHLGLNGLFNLYTTFLKSLNRAPNKEKLFIIGELPEELQSYRHVLACLLDEYNIKQMKCKCLTGDIGLTIGLPTTGIFYGDIKDRKHPEFAVRCMKCNQNNEYVSGEKKDGDNMVYLPHYHSINKIDEIPLKACQNRIAWLCTKHHASGPPFAKFQYFLKPDLRSVCWDDF